MLESECLSFLYLSAIYEVELADGVARFRVGDSVPGKPFALITAYNPGRSRPSAEVNATANERLEAAIRARGYEYGQARGQSPDGSHSEPSIAVFDMPFDAAVHLAKDFGQAAFVWFDGETTTLSWTDERMDGGAT